MAKKSKFEAAIVDKVKTVRIEKSYSQDDIAEILGVSRGFIGQVESPNSPSKYNFNHLNQLALAMGCSPQDFIPHAAIPGGSKSKKKR